MKPMVVIVEDERKPLAYYRLALEDGGFHPLPCREVDEALATLEANCKSVVAVVLDVMMPPGAAFGGEDTNEGINTGLLLHRKIADLWPHIPVIIVSNRTPEELLPLITGNAKPASVVHKPDCPPYRLVDVVRDVVRAKRRDPQTQQGERQNG